MERRAFASAYRPFVVGGLDVTGVPARDEADETRLLVERTVPRRSEPGMRPPSESMLGFLLMPAGSGGTGTSSVLGLHPSKLLVGLRVPMVSPFRFSLAFFLLLGLIVAAVPLVSVLPSLPPRFAQLFMRAIERMLFIARNAMEPWACVVSGAGGGVSKPSVPLSELGAVSTDENVESVDSDERVPLRWRGA